MNLHTLEEMDELFDFETGKKIEGPCLVILRCDDDFVLIGAARYREKMSNRDWKNAAENYDPKNSYCLGRLYKKQLNILGHMTDDVLKEEFPQVYEYFHGARA